MKRAVLGYLLFGILVQAGILILLVSGPPHRRALISNDGTIDSALHVVQADDGAGVKIKRVVVCHGPCVIARYARMDFVVAKRFRRKEGSE
jgi:hypothetical protein